MKCKECGGKLLFIGYMWPTTVLRCTECCTDHFYTYVDNKLVSEKDNEQGSLEATDEHLSE
jgi:hypothetical protein